MPLMSQKERIFQNIKCDEFWQSETRWDVVAQDNLSKNRPLASLHEQQISFHWDWGISFVRREIIRETN